MMKPILRTTLLLLALVAAACAAGKPQVIGPNDFAVSYAETLRSAAPAADVQIAGPLELSVERDGEQFTVFLDNAYAGYRADPERLQEVIEDHVGGILEAGVQGRAPLDASRVVPVIKGPGFLNTFIERGGSAGGAAQLPAYDQYNDNLIILYAEDEPRSLRYLYDQELTESGISRDSRLPLAVRNLRALLPNLETYSSGGIVGIGADGIYESSLLLFDELWTGDGLQRFGLRLAGEPVVAVPTRNLLLVVDSRDSAGVELLRELATRMFAAEPYPVSNEVFLYRNGRFQPY